ncbi:hypothetical protein ROS62_07075 [Streptomyces sp. DSM 41972]|uniref:Transcriptional regulator n=1 Tax=Streptomyces althioticus subsp. attaecolombicae TaxID=3075534 RepID=A0ABU3HWJ5_9ACTN|nr:hypothetical protein [Streptomyces sp. DSM 41972]
MPLDGLAGRFAVWLCAPLDGHATHGAIGLRGTGRPQVLGHVREFLDKTLAAGA